MKSRGADQPEESADQRRKGRRWGRGKAEAAAAEPVGGEEFGWIDDLRTAKAQRAELGPEGGPGPSTPPQRLGADPGPSGTGATPPVRRDAPEAPRPRPDAGRRSGSAKPAVPPGQPAPSGPATPPGGVPGPFAPPAPPGPSAPPQAQGRGGPPGPPTAEPVGRGRPAAPARPPAAAAPQPGPAPSAGRGGRRGAGTPTGAPGTPTGAPGTPTGAPGVPPVVPGRAGDDPTGGIPLATGGHRASAEVGRAPGHRAAPPSGGVARHGRRETPEEDTVVPRGRPSAPEGGPGPATPAVNTDIPSPRTDSADPVPSEGRRARPKRPADWLRQAGRTPHQTDPTLRPLNQPAVPPGSPVAPRSAPPAGGRGPADGSRSGPEPSRGGSAAGRARPGPAGPHPGVVGPARPHPPAGPAAERPRPSAAASGAIGEPPPPGPGIVRPGRPDQPPPRAAAGPPPRGAAAGPPPRAAAGPPSGTVAPRRAGVPTPPGVARPDGIPGGPPGMAAPPGVARPGAAPPGPARPGDAPAGPRPAAGTARPAGPRPSVDERPSGRALPPPREPARATPQGVPPTPLAATPDGPPPGGAEPPAVDTAAPEGSGGARSYLRRQPQQRLRTVALALASIVLLGVVPAVFGLQTLNRDPVFDTLDQLAVPTWAATETVDDVSGSRWCLLDCRLRERTVVSERSPEETVQVYEASLRGGGWQPWQVDRCPEQSAKGSYTCWRRDELTLDLWVREPACVPPPVDGEPALVPSPDPSTQAAECTGSLVSVKVRNAIDDDRTRPQPSTDPSLTGEDPFPTLSEDPLGELTPSPS